MKKVLLVIGITLLFFHAKSQLYDVNGNYNIKGNVGIGTQSSSFDLHIQSPNANLYIQNTDPSKWSYMRLKGSGANFWDLAQYGDNDYLEIRPQGASGNYRTVFKQNGNVGFGAINPSARIHAISLSSGGGDNGNAAIFESSGGNGIVTIRSKNSDHFAALYGSLGTDLVGAIDFRPSTGDFSFYTNDIGGSTWRQRMIIKNNTGNVGIGTTNPGQYKLAVEGKIGAHEIVVTTEGWSDFVFDTDYKLKDLEEVESFIEENNHLPDIPSEKEVLENGIKLGEMDAKLLQKIEELTLYMIEQNKITKRLVEDVQMLRAENKILKEKYIH